MISGLSATYSTRTEKLLLERRIVVGSDSKGHREIQEPVSGKSVDRNHTRSWWFVEIVLTQRNRFCNSTLCSVCCAHVHAAGSLSLYDSTACLEHAKYDHLPGPKRASFYLGHVSVIFSSTRRLYNDTPDKKASELKPLYFTLLIDWFNRCGDTLVLFILHLPIVVSRSPTVHRILLVDTDQRIVAKGFQFSLTRLYDFRYLGEGLATAVDHDAWYQRRKAIDPMFHRHQLRLSVDVFNAAADIFMQELVGYAESGETFQLNPILHLITFDVIMKTMFSMESTSLHTDFHKQATKFVEESFRELQVSLVPFSKYYPWRRQQRKYIYELLDSFRQVGGKMIVERRDSIARGDVVPRDFLTTMIEASADQATGYTDEVMKDEFVTMIIAGIVTSANILGFVFMELGRNPELVQG